jgi:O-antigen ligase
MLVLLFWDNLLGTWFADLYFYVPDYLGTGTQLFRAGGLHQNPHVSALFMTVLLILLLVGIQREQLRLSNPLTLLSLALAVALPVLLASRSETIAAALLVFGFGVSEIRAKRLGIRYASAALATLVIAALLILVSPAKNTTWSPNRVLAHGIGNFIGDPLNEDGGLGRPFRYWRWGIVPQRFAASPFLGSGPEDTGYHNDFLIVLVSTGIAGLVVLLVIILLISRIHIALIAPFLIAGTTNSLLFAPQHLAVLMIAAGGLLAYKRDFGSAEWKGTTLTKRSGQVTNTPRTAAGDRMSP